MKEFSLAEVAPNSTLPGTLVTPPDKEGEPPISSALSILPLRNLVLFPGTVARSISDGATRFGSSRTRCRQAR